MTITTYLGLRDRHDRTVPRSDAIDFVRTWYPADSYTFIDAMSVWEDKFESTLLVIEQRPNNSPVPPTGPEVITFARQYAKKFEQDGVLVSFGQSVEQLVTVEANRQ